MNRNPSMAGLASLVQSRGRKGDTMLVHMAPEEVKGLQSLALAAGGSLSVNPDTGLYEANFLKKLLPTLLGFGLNFMFPGLGALGSGLLVGAGETIRTGGDLGKGLMAGLGAFGGAGLGSALAGAGAVAGGAGQAGITAAGETAAAEAAKQGAQQAAIEAAKKKAIEEATKKAVAEQAAQKGIASGAAGWQNIKAGAGSLFKTSPGIGALGGADALGATFNALPGGMIGKAGLVTSAANAFTPDMEVPGDGYQIDDSYYESAGYSPEQGRFLGGQWRKGYPGFPGYAMGGAVMPRTNYNYPQAGITKSNYAPSLEYAKPREILDGYDAKIDPFTGEEKFADGGSVDQPVNVIDRAAPISNQQTVNAVSPSQMEQYYQSLLTPPQQTAADPKFAEYLQNLNKFVTSPVAPPPPPPKPPATTPTTPTTPNQPFDPSTIDFSNFNFGDFMNGGYGDIGQYLANLGQTQPMRWDAAQGRFVSGTGTPTATTPTTTTSTTSTQNQYDPSQFQYNPFQDGFDYSQFLNSENRLNNQDTAPAATAATGTTTTPSRSMELMRKSMMGEPLTDEDKAWMAQTDAENERNFKAQFGNTMPPVTDMMGGEPQINVRNVGEGFDYAGGSPNFDMGNYALGDMGGYGADMMGGEPQINVRNVGEGFDYAGGTPSFDMGNVNIAGQQPFQYDFSGMGQMGDMGAYATPFQGFQPQSTDFGSTYQAPAMNTPIFNAQPYAPQQQMDFGSMGDYGLGALGTTYSAPTFQAPTMDFSSPAPSVPTTSFQNPMTTGPMSTGETAPQFGFGNSDVLYGETSFGGGEPNIFGFAGGGAIQKAAAGKLVTGDGDGMSDDIRANINGNQEARLADGEFVIPADVVSHLGNGSTDAGADRLYSMMDRIRKARTGRTRQAPEIDAEKYLLA